MLTRTTLPAALLATLAVTAFAQQASPPPAAPAAPAPPAWKQGMSPGQEQSTLHPFAATSPAARPASCRSTS